MGHTKIFWMLSKKRTAWTLRWQPDGPMVTMVIHGAQEAHYGPPADVAIFLTGEELGLPRESLLPAEAAPRKLEQQTELKRKVHGTQEVHCRSPADVVIFLTVEELGLPWESLLPAEATPRKQGA